MFLRLNIGYIISFYYIVKFLQTMSEKKQQSFIERLERIQNIIKSNENDKKKQ